MITKGSLVHYGPHGKGAVYTVVSVGDQSYDLEGTEGGYIQEADATFVFSKVPRVSMDESFLNVQWTKQDVADYLSNSGTAETPEELIDMVFDELKEGRQHERMEEAVISTGWETLALAVDRVFENWGIS